MQEAIIPGFDGFYKAGDDGTIYSCKIGGSRGKSKGPWKQLKTYICNHTGREMVGLRVSPGRPKLFYVHRLILEAFVGPCPDGMQCRHYPDQDPTNNTLANLSWASQETNMQDKPENGTNYEGERHRNAKLTEDKVREIRLLYASRNWCRKELARRFNVTRSNISFVLRGETWKTVSLNNPKKGNEQ